MPALTVWLFGDRTTPARQAGATVREFNRLVVATALAACVLLVFVSGLLLVRRLAGHFEANLSALALLSVGALLVSVVAAPRLAGAWLTAAHGNEPLRAAFLILPAISVFMLGVSLSYFSAPVWPLVVVWLAILAEEAAWWTIYFRGRQPRTRTCAVSPPQAVAAIVSELRQVPDSALEMDSEIVPANIVQQMTRIREENGRESLHGVMRGSFAPGERTQNLHLAFCPPLASVPELSFEQVDGPPATIKAAQVESFGARLEVRLDAAQPEPSDVLVEFSCH